MAQHKHLLLQRFKAFEREEFAPFAGIETRRIAFMAIDDLIQFTHPTDARIAHVPHRAEFAAGLENALDFRQRLRRGEPMEGLGAHHGIHRLVR